MSPQPIINVEETLKKLFLILCYDSFTNQSILNKIIFVMNDYIPVIGISLSSYYNKYIYRVARGGCLDNIFNEIHSYEVGTEILNSFEYNPFSVQAFPGDDPALSQLFKDLYKEGTNFIQIPLGAISSFPGYSYMNVYFTGSTVFIPRYIDCCERFRPVFIFFSALIYHNMQWSIEGGRLMMREKTDGETAPAMSAEAYEEGARTLEEVNRDYIQLMLRRTGGRVAGEHGAAHRLGLKPTTLWAKIRKYNIAMPKKEGE